MKRIGYLFATFEEITKKLTYLSIFNNGFDEEEDNGEKTSIEMLFETPNGTQFSIYDYKQSYKNEGAFHISGTEETKDEILSYVYSIFG